MIYYMDNAFRHTDPINGYPFCSDILYPINGCPFFSCLDYFFEDERNGNKTNNQGVTTGCRRHKKDAKAKDRDDNIPSFDLSFIG